MSVVTPLRAATAPVCPLAELPPLERRFVVAARLWRAGPAGRAELERALAARHGTAVGRTAHDRLDALMRLLGEHARRTVRFAPSGAEGAAGDECVLARLVAHAAEGEREEAILLAALILRADLALELARLATALGHLLMREPGAVVPLRG